MAAGESATSPDSARPSLWDRLAGPYCGGGLSDECLPRIHEMRMRARTEEFSAPVAGSARAKALLEHRLASWRYLSGPISRDDDLLRFTQMLSRGGPAVAPAGLFWVPIYFCWISFKRLLGMGTIKRLDRALRTKTCPDCSYPLGGLARVAGEVCPARCPGCNAGWPLLPPGMVTEVDGVPFPRA